MSQASREVERWVREHKIAPRGASQWGVEHAARRPVAPATQAAAQAADAEAPIGADNAEGERQMAKKSTAKRKTTTVAKKRAATKSASAPRARTPRVETDGPKTKKARLRITTPLGISVVKRALELLVESAPEKTPTVEIAEAQRLLARIGGLGA